MALMATIMNKIIDIHNHSLPGVDDGARTLEEAISNIRYLASLGVNDIVLTSHYILNSKYNSSVSAREEILKELKEHTKDLEVNLYLGNEVFISDSKTILKLLAKKEITTINNSKYLLIEFPLNHKINHLDEIICELNEAGITPIIAHPERYTYFARDITKLKELLEYDCLLACNIESISGVYGDTSKKLIKKLLKENLVNILATDYHHYNKFLTKSLKKLSKILSEEQLEVLLYTNPKKIIENERL